MDIDIHVLQSITTEEDTETFEINTVGQLVDKQHSYITYTETLDDITTNVRVKLEKNRIRIRRIGELSMDFLFVPTETTQNIYHMANQRAVMDITTNQLVIKREDRTGHIFIQYSITTNNTVIGTYSYELTYKERA